MSKVKIVTIDLILNLHRLEPPICNFFFSFYFHVMAKHSFIKSLHFSLKSVAESITHFQTGTAQDWFY